MGAHLNLKMPNKRAVFLDRNGTLIEERHYLHLPEEVAVYPRAVQALRRLRDADYELFLVTNQSGVGRGYFSMADVEKVHAHLEAELARDGVNIARIYTAPEAPDQPSRGRKPSPQFLFDARDEFGIDLARSYMIGDKLIDLECGQNAKQCGEVSWCAPVTVPSRKPTCAAVWTPPWWSMIWGRRQLDSQSE